jgi:arsenate reductase (thioredoxin)
MSQTPFNVLFLCTGNSARSIMAEALLNAKGGHKFKSHSAGSYPNGTVNPFALRQIASAGLPSNGYRSKSWAEFAAPGAPKLDFIFTVCDNAAGELCPVWPGQPVTAHWGVDDPAAVMGTDAEIERAFFLAFEILQRRVELFTSLPIQSLSELALRDKLSDIGKAV